MRAGEPSDPYLMAGYRTKSVALSHDATRRVTFVIEVAFVGNGDWSPYARIDVGAGKTVRHQFPAGYSAHRVRLKTDHDTTATATFTYTY